MGFVYRVSWTSKSPVNCFVWNHQFFEIFAKNNHTSGCPIEFYHNRFMYKVAPSNDRSLLTLILPFWGGLRLFSDVCMEWECCTFQKIDENSLNPPILLSILWLQFLFFRIIYLTWHSSPFELLLYTMYKTCSIDDRHFRDKPRIKSTGLGIFLYLHLSMHPITSLKAGIAQA